MAVVQSDPTNLTAGPGESIVPLLSAYRKRIRRARRRQYISSALLAVSAIWVVAALLYYGGTAPGILLPVCLALTVLLPAGAFAYEALRQPSITDTARALDARLDNKQRLVTSVELLGNTAPVEAAQSAISAVQLESTGEMLGRANPKAVYPVRTPWSSVLLSMGLLMLAMGIFALKGLPGDFSPLQPFGLPGSEQAAALASPTAQSGLPNADQQQAQATPTQQSGQGAQGQSGQQSDSSGANQGAGDGNASDPASQAASQDAQQGLDRLGQGLGEQSVTQRAAESLRQGNYEDAARQLEELGRENDQLSEGAKRDLSDSLEGVAQDPATTPEISAAAQAAADALRQGDYKAIEQAMQNLGDALKRAAQDIIPQEELAKSFPEQGQQGQQGQSAQTPQDGQQQGDQAQQGQEDQGGQEGQQQSGQPAQPGQQGNSSADGEGQQDGQAQQGSASDQQNQNSQQGQGSAPGQGTRVGEPVDEDDPDVAGNPFEIEGQPDQGRPSNNNEPPALTLEGSAASGEAAPVSPGSAVTAQGESNNMPVERWEVIQRYFGGGR